MKRPRTYRETMEQNDRAQQGWANAMGVPVAEKYLNRLPAIKPHKPRAPSSEPSESQILKSIMQLLKRHPKVAMCWRQNSGTFREGDRFIRANTARGMSDIMGTLKNGRTLAIEVKSRTGTIQPHQVEFLAGITKAGGLAFVARDVETVVRVLADI